MELEHYIQYREFPGIQCTHFRPVLLASFAFNGRSYEWSMLVDTGADGIILPYSMMPMLGITEDDCEAFEAGTALGVAGGWRGPNVAVSFPDYWEDRTFNAPAVFTPDRDNRPYGLLGREPFLDHFGCRFGHQGGHGFVLSVASD